MSQTLSMFVTTVGVALASVIAALLVAIQRQVLSKLHWQVTSAQEDVERTAIENVVLYVEQWAARELDGTDATLRAIAKLRKAKTLVLAKCPWLADPDLEAAIEAALARFGLGAVAVAVAVAHAK
jgi:superfamily 6 holin (LLH)